MRSNNLLKYLSKFYYCTFLNVRKVPKETCSAKELLKKLLHFAKINKLVPHKRNTRAGLKQHLFFNPALSIKTPNWRD